MAREVSRLIDEDNLLGWIEGGRQRAVFLRSLLTDLAEHATAEQRIYAPSGETGYLHAHIRHGSLTYHPGGPGGGGSYQIVSGVVRGTSQHPLYVHQGTANPSDASIVAANRQGFHPSQGRIYPRGDRADASVVSTRRARRGYSFGDDGIKMSRRPVLTFQKRGEPRKFRAWVSGQRPQPFVYFAFISTAIYAQGRLRASAALF